MGLYITGNFEPPRANYKLVQLWYDGYAHFLTEDGMVTGTWTLVPDHGDLVEKDAAMAVAKLALPAESYDGLCRATQALEWLDHAPVIIPAERSEE